MQSPASRCPNCGVLDWSLNGKGLWICTKCGSLPGQQEFPADEWCEMIFKEYELASREHHELVESPSKDGESPLMRSARLRRAEKKLAAADIKASAASLLQLLMTSTKNGVVTFSLPEIDLSTKLTWIQK